MVDNFIRLAEPVKLKSDKRVVAVEVRPTITDCTGSIWVTDIQFLEGEKLTGYIQHSTTMLTESGNQPRFQNGVIRSGATAILFNTGGTTAGLDIYVYPNAAMPAGAIEVAQGAGSHQCKFKAAALSTIRKLKEHGTEVFFEKEYIWTFDSKGELLITIMSSLAQEESRSISENVTWGHRKRMADGKVALAYSQFLGFEKGENGTLKVNEAEARLVRRIFAMFVEGGTAHTIAATLTNEGIPSPTGKPTWNHQTIRRMLTTEKYKGDALLQKTYVADFLTKKQVANKGEIPQYYVEGAHEAIIDPAVFDMVQQEIEARKTSKGRYSGKGIIGSRIRCVECEAWCGAKVWHSTSKYRRTVYQCNQKWEGDKKCGTPHLAEETIKREFIKAVNKLLGNRNEVLGNLREIKAELFDGLKLEVERAALQSELAVVTELIQKNLPASASVVHSDEQQKHLDGLIERFDATRTQIAELTETITSRSARRDRLDMFIRELANQPDLITEWDDRLWVTQVDYATAHSHSDLRFTFKDGTGIAAG